MSDETLDGLAQSFVKRWRDGERPSITEYVELHPELKDDILAIFPALIALEKAAPAASPEAPPPADLGEFRILREVGRGGMGVVYEAEQLPLCRRVALKVLPRHACRDDRVLDRFRREAQAAARLHHTNIVPVYGVGEHEGTHYYAMQFVHGQPLDEVIAELRKIRRGHSSGAGGDLAGLARPDSRAAFFKSVARLGMQVADALAYAHGQGVVHRDIKPSNLMLDAAGTVWVTDFGLAQAQGADTLTKTGDIVGTLGYMAPERLRGWSDPRSDIYSLGLTLYEMLVLRPAFCDTDVNRLIKRIAESNPPALRRRSRGIPRDLETIVLRATAKEPADRYQSAADLAADLGLFLADRPIRAQPVSAIRRIRAWSRRNPLAAGLSAAVVLLLVTVAGVSAGASLLLRRERDTALGNLGRADAAERQLREELRASNVARARASRGSRRPGQRFEALEQLARAAAIRPAIDLRNDVLATLPLLDIRGLRHWREEETIRPAALDPVHRRFASVDKEGNITLRTVPDGEETMRLAAGGSTVVAGFSPDGNCLGAISKTGPSAVLRVWDLEQGRVLLEEPSCAEAHTVHFDAKGRVVFGAPDRSIVIVDLAGGGRKRLPGGEASLSRLRLSPDGRSLLATAGRDTVHVLDPERGEIATVEFPGQVFDIAWHPSADRFAVAVGQEVRVWDLSDASLVRVFQGHHGTVTAVSFGANGTLLVSAGWDRRTVVWDAATGEQHLTLPRAASLAWPYLYGVDGKEAWLDELATSACVATLDDDSVVTGPSRAEMSPDRRLMATASGDGIRLWDLAHAREIAFLPLRGVVLVALPTAGEMISATGDRILSWPLARDGEEELLRVGPPRVLHEEPMPKDEGAFPTDRDLRFVDKLREALGSRPICLAERRGRPGISVSADGRWAATTAWKSWDLQLWDLPKRARVRTLRVYSGQATFTPDGRHLVANGVYEPCKVFDTGTWEPVREIESESTGIALSPDGTLLALARAPSGAALFDAATGTPVAVLESTSVLPTGSLSFGPQGDRLAVAQPHRVQVWDLGLLQRELARLGLDRGLPPPAAPAGADTKPIRAEVSMGPAADRDADVPIRGGVVVVDGRGVEHPRENGTFTLMARQPDGSASGHSVRVVSGAWETRIGPGAGLTIVNMTLGGRLAIVDGGDVPFPEDGILELKARWPDPLVLRVLAADGATHLRGVEIVRNGSWEHDDDIHPAGDPKAESILKGVTSPALLPGGEKNHVYWVRAPGYAWKRVEIDHRSPGERTLQLEPGGSLEITLDNAGPAEDAHLYLYTVPDESGKPALDVEPKPPATTVIDGLAAGEYAVAYTVGQWFQRPIRLARGTVRVEAGVKVPLTLTLVAQPPEKKRAPLSGTIEIPAAWGKMQPRLSVESLQRGAEFNAWVDKITEEKPGTHRWDAGAVPVGRCIAEIDPFELQVVLLVPAAGNREARIVIPEPADLVVRVLDRATNEPADLDELAWNFARPAASTSGGLGTVRRDPASGTFSLRVPAGAIEFSAMGGPWMGLQETRKVPPGRSEITFLVDAACGIEIALKDGETTVPFSDSVDVSAELADGEDASSGTSYDTPLRTLWVREAGSYRLVFSGMLDGYEPPGPQSVTAERGKTVRVVVMLKRKR